uniref:Uncharacterized protein n=1 Tax=Daphnia galeata TaxID=27404 RepID=A0A8J2RGI6_9CRUS|nr:unnamed protein product [Daphnia galeata]
MHNNQPILMEVFRDPDTEKDKVIVVASLVGCTTDVEFTLLGSGPGTTFAQISYKWAPNSFNIEKLFAKEIKTGKIPSGHPKIVQLKKGLQNYRDSKDDTPIGTIDLTLPIPVLTTENSISRSGRKKKDGTIIMIIELTAYESLYSVKQETKKVLFDLETES